MKQQHDAPRDATQDLDETRSRSAGGVSAGSVQDALAVLSRAMQEDGDFAWAWHCNIAMAAVDAGALHKNANERAADFMRHAFGVDMRKNKHWAFVIGSAP